jgi:hypothetical protein
MDPFFNPLTSTAIGFAFGSKPTLLQNIFHEKVVFK